MCEFEKYSDVLEHRKVLVETQLRRNISDRLHLGQLSKVCSELDMDSSCGRNWRGLTRYLIEPEPCTSTIDKWSKHTSPAYEVLCTWVADSCEQAQAQPTFRVLLDALIANQSFSAADELLCFLEALNIAQDTAIEEINGISSSGTGQDLEQVQAAGTSQIATTNNVTSPTTGTYKRSKSLVERIYKCVGKKFRRSESYPPDNSSIENIQPPQPAVKREKDEIFIVCSSQDYQSESMRDLKSFVSHLQPVLSGNWRVETIHDLPGGPVLSWLSERVERAAYVIICCSRTTKEIANCGTNGAVLKQQSEYNLKFTLDFLVSTRIYLDMCRNVDGKFLPIIMPGNDITCVLNLLVTFKVFSWPEELKGIRNYMMGESERKVPKLGQKKPLIPHRLH